MAHTILLLKIQLSNYLVLIPNAYELHPSLAVLQISTDGSVRAMQRLRDRSSSSHGFQIKCRLTPPFEANHFCSCITKSFLWGNRWFVSPSPRPLLPFSSCHLALSLPPCS